MDVHTKEILILLQSGTQSLQQAEVQRRTCRSMSAGSSFVQGGIRSDASNRTSAKQAVMIENHRTFTIAIPESLNWTVYHPRVSEEQELILHWNPHQSIKDAVESIGIPHTEIQRYFCSSEQAPESYIVMPGDELSIEPVDALPYSSSRVFIADTHLGKLATYLRLLGFPTLYQRDWSPEELLGCAHHSGAVVLSRSRELLKRRQLEQGMLIRSTQVDDQLVEVFIRFALQDHLQLLSLCPHCNAGLIGVEKDDIIDQLEPNTRQWYQRFFRCSQCGQIYWYGSHYEQLTTMIATITDRISSL